MSWRDAIDNEQWVRFLAKNHGKGLEGLVQAMIDRGWLVTRADHDQNLAHSKRGFEVMTEAAVEATERTRASLIKSAGDAVAAMNRVRRLVRDDRKTVRMTDLVNALDGGDQR